jgi:lipopolysaccharide export system permease protein
MLNKAKSQADNIYNQAKNNENVIKTYLTAEAKHIIELHTKFLTAIMCIVFVFVGAPMGAIVRKGGFGYPVLIAILMFILYIFSYLMFRKLGEQRSVNPLIASWLPCILMCVIGGYLTYHAMRDSRVFKPERFKKVAVFFKILKSKLKR